MKTVCMMAVFAGLAAAQGAAKFVIDPQKDTVRELAQDKPLARITTDPPTPEKAAAAPVKNESKLRPAFELPAELQFQYFRQAWVIEHAMAGQAETVRKIQAACTEAASKAQMVRGDDGELKWFCVPEPVHEEKAK